MFRSIKRNPIVANLIGGSLFAVAIASHGLDRTKTQPERAPVQLSPAQVADALAVVSEACRHISLQPGQKPVTFTDDDLASAMAVVSEVCTDYGRGASVPAPRLQRSEVSDNKLAPARRDADIIDI